MPDSRPATVRWLPRPDPTRVTGVTWGVPWPRGTVAADAPFALREGTDQGASVPVQSWVTATWPDGSVKWSAHALAPRPDSADAYVLVPGEKPAITEPAVQVTEAADTVTVDTATVTWVVARRGPVLVRSAVRDDREVVRDVRLVSLWQPEPTPDVAGAITREELRGEVTSCTVEQTGPVRAVIRLEGRHTAASTTHPPPTSRAGSTVGGLSRSRNQLSTGESPPTPGPGLPFTVRLYFYAGAEDVRVVHSFVWDGEADRDFLGGLGVQVDVPMRDEPHDRHVRLAGPAGDDHRPGFLTEAVRGITGLRRDPGERFRAAQVAGRPCGPVDAWDPAVSRRVHLIPTWNDWTLDQLSADGFTLRKRTGSTGRRLRGSDVEGGRSIGGAWVAVPAGSRSAGYGYLGGVSGGLGFGLRDFWKLHPTRLDVRGAATETATATVWLWSPSAPAMDLRYWHDGLGQDTFADQLEGLEVTYEDYEPGFGDPHGVARTHELTLRAHAATPSAAELADHAAASSDPPLLVSSPERLHAAGVFGDWAPVDRSSPARAEIEDRLDFLLDFYVAQREQRRWYGFWDYGDVMHTYDADRHQWRYDVGGYAWDNSELSPDLWLWYQFLRTGRADVFRFAEAMTRHTGEVDVYHRGRWQGLGTRHNVQHWGCSAKQLRISSAAYRRFHYYLTADERTGDLLRELAAAERTFLALDPLRKIRTEPYTPDRHALSIGLGTDWGALAAAWLTQWERTPDQWERTPGDGDQAAAQSIRDAARGKLLGTMRDIGRLPHGFFTGEALLDLDTGRFGTGRSGTGAAESPVTHVSHLSAVFGLVELCSELISLTHGTSLEDPAFERAWLDYCRLYLATPEEQEAAFGQPLAGVSLVQAHSRLTAYAAARGQDFELARRAWRAFRRDLGDQLNVNPLQREPEWRTARVAGPGVLTPVDEAPYVSTNSAAQYGLAAIQNLALIANWLEP